MVAALALILGACGGGAPSTAPRAAVGPAPDPELAPVRAAGIDQVRRGLWWLYEDDVVLYRGTVEARNNLGAVVSGTLVGRLDRDPDNASELGPAVAIRLVRDGDDRGALLLWQPASDAAITGIVGPFGRTDGVGLGGSRCTQCVTPFGAAPPSILVAAAATGVWGDGTPANASARGGLARIAPHELRASELAALFETETGIEAEAHDGSVSIPIEGALSRPVAIDPPPENADCSERRPWAAVASIALPELTVRVTDIQLGAWGGACCLARCVPEHPCDGRRCEPVEVAAPPPG